MLDRGAVADGHSGARHRRLRRRGARRGPARARPRGAASSRSAAATKQDAVRAAGADAVVDRRRGAVVAGAAAAAPSGYDAVVDVVAGRRARPRPRAAAGRRALSRRRRARRLVGRPSTCAGCTSPTWLWSARRCTRRGSSSSSSRSPGRATVRPVVAATFGLEQVLRGAGPARAAPARRQARRRAVTARRDRPGSLRRSPWPSWRSSGPRRRAVDGAAARVELGEPEAGVEQVVAVLPGHHQQRRAAAPPCRRCPWSCRAPRSAVAGIRNDPASRITSRPSVGQREPAAAAGAEAAGHDPVEPVAAGRRAEVARAGLQPRRRQLGHRRRLDQRRQVVLAAAPPPAAPHRRGRRAPARANRISTGSQAGCCSPGRRHCELAVEDGGLAAQERRDDPAGQLRAGVRRVARERRRLGGVDHAA